jgi:two-component system, NtrC family, sensor kinase
MSRPEQPRRSRRTQIQTAADRALASEARLAGILEIAEDAIISVDAEQRITLFNRGAGTIFGYASAEVIGRPLEMLLPERFRERHRLHIAAFGAGDEQARMMGARGRIWGRRKNGEEFPAEASISKLQAGDELVLTVILRDITQYLRAEDRLEQQVRSRTAHLNTMLAFSTDLLGARRLDEVLERGLRHAMALVPEADRGALYLDQGDGVSLALRVSVGFERPPPLSMPLPGDRNQPLEAIFQTAASRGVVAIPLRSDGRVQGLLVLWRRTQDGRFAGDTRLTLEGLANLLVAAIVEAHGRAAASAMASELADLHARQQLVQERLNTAEAGMLQAARLAAVGQLSASVAHEINNPLYAIRNSLFLLEEDLPAELSESPYLQLATEQLERIARIIERMREFYRPQRGELVAQDLNRLLEDTLALVGLDQRYGSLRMVFTPAPDLQPIIGDGDQLRQVFLNLMLNAIDAMPSGGTLTVRTRAEAAAIVEIEDTGIGIPDEIRPRLFEPFFTSKASGTGLGLAISAHIVTQHGGRIEVESRLANGSLFRVVLPVRTGEELA